MLDQLAKLWLDATPPGGYQEVDDDHWTWLDGLSHVQAFLVCLGAGPWKEGRRLKVQRIALGSYKMQGSPPLRDVDPLGLGYPLQWQIDKISKLSQALKHIEYRVDGQIAEEFDYLCSVMISIRDPECLYGIVGRCKTVELFVRDHLKLPSFPIDRHVRRALKWYGLPDSPKVIIDGCHELGNDPRLLSRALFRVASENPKVGGSK